MEERIFSLLEKFLEKVNAEDDSKGVLAVILEILVICGVTSPQAIRIHEIEQVLQRQL